MNKLLQMACNSADSQDLRHACAIDDTCNGGDIYFRASETRPPLIDWARGFEKTGSVIYLADKLSNGWEAY